MKSSAFISVCGFISITGLFTWFECNRTVLAQSENKQTLTEQQNLREQQASAQQFSTEQMQATELPYKYCGNVFSHKFHRPSCPFGMCISKQHLILFHFRKEAIEAHFVPCKYCLPPVWWSVHGVVLPRKADPNKDKLNNPTTNLSESRDD